jgi:hypothetical protein
VAVRLADGAPEVALAPPTAPIVVMLAFLNETTVIDPRYDPLALVAVTEALVSTDVADAVQISDVPCWVFTRFRNVHVSPPPVTDEKLCVDAFGPSEEINATSNSLP